MVKTSHKEQYDDDLTLGLLDDKGSGFTDLFEYSLDDSPMASLKSLIVELDWEITDEALIQVNEEILLLRREWGDEKIKLVYLQALEQISKYIYQLKADALPGAISLLPKLFTNLEKVCLEGFSDEQALVILAEDVRRFEELKKSISLQRRLEPNQILTPVKSILLDIDWEITEDELAKLVSELERLQVTFSSIEYIPPLLQDMLELARRLFRSHLDELDKESFVFLQEIFTTLEQALREDVSINERKQLVSKERQRYHKWCDRQREVKATVSDSEEFLVAEVESLGEEDMELSVSEAESCCDKLLPEEPKMAQSVDSALALEGVAVETPEDDDSQEQALPQIKGELAPALSFGKEEAEEVCNSGLKEQGAFIDGDVEHGLEESLSFLDEPVPEEVEGSHDRGELEGLFLGEDSLQEPTSLPEGSTLMAQSVEESVSVLADPREPVVALAGSDEEQGSRFEDEDIEQGLEESLSFLDELVPEKLEGSLSMDDSQQGSFSFGDELNLAASEALPMEEIGDALPDANEPVVALAASDGEHGSRFENEEIEQGLEESLSFLDELIPENDKGELEGSPSMDDSQQGSFSFGDELNLVASEALPAKESGEALFGVNEPVVALAASDETQGGYVDDMELEQSVASVSSFSDDTLELERELAAHTEEKQGDKDLLVDEELSFLQDFFAEESLQKKSVEEDEVAVFSADISIEDGPKDDWFKPFRFALAALELEISDSVCQSLSDSIDFALEQEKLSLPLSSLLELARSVVLHVLEYQAYADSASYNLLCQLLVAIEKIEQEKGTAEEIFASQLVDVLAWQRQLIKPSVEQVEEVADLENHQEIDQVKCELHALRDEIQREFAELHLKLS